MYISRIMMRCHVLAGRCLLQLPLLSLPSTKCVPLLAAAHVYHRRLRPALRTNATNTASPAVESALGSNPGGNATTRTDVAASHSSVRQRQGPTFQEAINRLQAYWSSKGCAMCMPHNTEVTCPQPAWKVTRFQEYIHYRCSAF